MDLDFNEIYVFVKVVLNGSFSKTAEQLRLPVSTVSTRITSLERRLGTTLLQRTTRKLVLTEVGRLYFERCKNNFDGIIEAENDLVSNKNEPFGTLKITAPVYLGSTLLPEIIAEMGNHYPQLKIEMILSDRELDLISEGIDIAVRAGPLKDSSLIAKKLGEAYFIPFASKKFLKEHGLPKHPKDLTSFRCISFVPLGRNEWEFFNSKTKIRVRIGEALIIDELNFVEALARKHQGIALLPNFVCKTKPEKEQLTRILPEWKSSHRPVFLVYPGQRFMSAKVRAFIDFAEEKLRATIGQDL